MLVTPAFPGLGGSLLWSFSPHWGIKNGGGETWWSLRAGSHGQPEETRQAKEMAKSNLFPWDIHARSPGACGGLRPHADQNAASGLFRSLPLRGREILAQSRRDTWRGAALKAGQSLSCCWGGFLVELFHQTSATGWDASWEQGGYRAGPVPGGGRFASPGTRSGAVSHFRTASGVALPLVPAPGGRGTLALYHQRGLSDQLLRHPGPVPVSPEGMWCVHRTLMCSHPTPCPPGTKSSPPGLPQANSALGCTDTG